MYWQRNDQFAVWELPLFCTSDHINLGDQGATLTYWVESPAQQHISSDPGNRHMKFVVCNSKIYQYMTCPHKLEKVNDSFIKKAE